MGVLFVTTLYISSSSLSEYPLGAVFILLPSRAWCGIEQRWMTYVFAREPRGKGRLRLRTPVVRQFTEWPKNRKPL